MAMAVAIASRAARSVRPGTSRICGWISAPSLVSRSSLPPLVNRRNVSQLSGHAPGDAPAGDGADQRDLLEGQPAEDLTQGASKYIVTFASLGLKFIQNEKDAATRPLRRTLLANIWLRDHCRCPQCVNQDTMQRSFRIFDIPSAVEPINVKVETDGVRVTWNHDQHESFYDWSFIERGLGCRYRPLPYLRQQTWGSEIAANPPTVGYEEAMDSTSERGMAKLTDLIMQHGFVFVDDTPSDDAVHTKKLLERIGPIRETHYGGFYDFVPDMAKADTAYTNIALPAHTDTTYFTDPAGLQAFHMLSHTAPDGAQPTGGESLLVDGFHAAEILRKEDPGSFAALCHHRMPWHASGNPGVTITSDQLHPVIELMRRGRINSRILRIRWNNDDRGVLPCRRNIGNETRWYAAAAKWDEILRRSNSEFWFQLRPGRTLIFDNYRVLHGRSAFTGWRRICGAYISRDDFMSRWRNTNLSREEVLAQVIG